MSVTIFTPPACQQFLNLHDGGATFVYFGQIDHGTPGGDPAPVDMLKASVNLVGRKFPLGWLDGFKVFLPGLILMPFDAKQKLWDPFNGYQAATYGSHMVIGDFTHPPAELDQLIAHELGHALCYRLVDQSYTDYLDTPRMAEYKGLRGLGREDPGLPWARRPWEIFAEDFKNEVVGLPAGDIPRAPEDLRPKLVEFFGRLGAKGSTPAIEAVTGPTEQAPAGPRWTIVVVRKRPGQITVNDRAVKLKSPVKYEPGVTYVPMREFCEAIGAQVSYDGPTGTATVTID